jgi:hypothetical protein
VPAVVTAGDYKQEIFMENPIRRRIEILPGYRPSLAQVATLCGVTWLVGKTLLPLLVDLAGVLALLITSWLAARSIYGHFTRPIR